MRLSVIIPTHNPRRDYLDCTLAALQKQSLPCQEWELLLVDNGSNPPLDPGLVAWHPHGRIVYEPTLGLVHARLAGLHAAGSDLLVWSDDDNVFEPTYLACALQSFDSHPRLGAAGGASLPAYEMPPPAWYSVNLAPIGCRDLGDKDLWAEWKTGESRHYPECAPIGAGLVIRREAMLAWAEAVRQDPRRKQFGRTGSALTSGEDNDINLTLLGQGWQLAYLPGLRLAHLIPVRRLELDYQCRIARAAFRDFTRVLLLHDASPWPVIPRWTVPLRQLKAWFSHRAWAGPAERVRWQGACGHFEGRAFPGPSTTP